MRREIRSVYFDYIGDDNEAEEGFRLRLEKERALPHSEKSILLGEY